MNTERPSPRYSRIDTWPPLDVMDAMLDGQMAAVAAVRAARTPLVEAAIAIEARLKVGGRLAYAGAGTSGRIAAQDGAELTPTFGWPSARIVVLIAGGSDALLRAVEGAEDDAEKGAALVRDHDLSGQDVLIAVSASGTTPFTLSCLRAANRLGALTVGIANNAGTAMLLEAGHAIHLETGGEPIAGSTRMNAGTAQRVTLSLLSTLVMIRLGRVYDGLMVDVLPSNAKLVARQEQMLIDLTGKCRDEVREALRRSDASVKLAALLLKGCDLDEARTLLDRAGGQLRTALELATGRLR